MLTQVKARNFLCFGDQDHQINFTPETMIVGPNNVGKSAIFAAFNFLRNTQYVGWQWDTPTYSLANFETAVHNHDQKRTIQLGVNVNGSDWSGQISADITLSSYNLALAPNNPQKANQELRKYWFMRASKSDVPRSMQVGVRGPSTSWGQQLDPDGSNVITYLLEKYTSRDKRWDVAEAWLKRIVPEFSVLKVPLRGRESSVETELVTSKADINVAYQGTGIQKALSTIAALVFSPEGSTIIIEEPEIHLHPQSQEVLVNLFNEAVNSWKKQVIFTTHSWNMLLPFISDIGEGTTRGANHVKANANDFKLVTFERDANNRSQIKEYDLRDKPVSTVRTHFKGVWG